MNAGKTLYKDIADQKGPLWFLFMMLLDKIPIKTTTTIWITEVIMIGLFSVLQYKIINIKLKNKQKSQIYAFLTTTLYVFSFPLWFAGGVCIEEYSVVLLSLQLYTVLKNESKALDKTDCILLGITSSIMFLTKYTSLIPTVILAITVIISYIKTKKPAKAYINTILYFIIGFMPLVLLCIAYLVNNGTLSDCIQIYFYDNIFSYKTPILLRLIAQVRAAGLILITMIVPTIFAPYDKNKPKDKMLTQALISFLLISISGAGYVTYYIVLYAYLGSTLTVMNEMKKKEKIYTYAILSGFVLLTIFSCADNINHKKVAQTEAAEIIKQYDDQSINTILSIDMGIYYALDTIPEYKYPYCLASLTSENTESQLSCVENKETNFIVSYENIEEYSETNIPRYEWFYGADTSGYELIYTAKEQDGYNTDLYLYKRID